MFNFWYIPLLGVMLMNYAVATSDVKKKGNVVCKEVTIGLHLVCLLMLVLGVGKYTSYLLVACVLAAICLGAVVVFNEEYTDTAMITFIVGLVMSLSSGMYLSDYRMGNESLAECEKEFKAVESCRNNNKTKQHVKTSDRDNASRSSGGSRTRDRETLTTQQLKKLADVIADPERDLERRFVALGENPNNYTYEELQAKFDELPNTPDDNELALAARLEALKR